MSTRAMITGYYGQDGQNLAELLDRYGYEIIGIDRYARERPQRTDKRHKIVTADLTDDSISQAIYEYQPDEIYNLGAMSHVRVSFDIPTYAFEANAVGVVRILEAIRRSKKKIKLYQASSSEMFGGSPAPQNEQTPFNPRSPYAVAKLAAHHFVVNYREAYGIFACSGILFNHEGPNRGCDFVTRKISKAVANIIRGSQKHLTLGNLDAKRDFGLSADYVKAMYLMMQHHTPDDYVIATGEMHSVREFVELAFRHVGITNWQDYVVFDETLLRPTEVNELCGDYTKAKTILGWEPSIKFADLVKVMVDADLASCN